MDMLHVLPPINFCGIEGSTYEKSKFVVLPVPFDSTVFYRPGTRDGPSAIIDASRNMETYDMELKADPSKIGIFTLDYLEPARGDVVETLRRVEEVVKQILSDSKIPILLGGEHSISVGAVNAFGSDVDVLQIDAHADLRDSFEGSKHSHACTIRRIREKHNAVQVGIRSISGDGARYAEKEKLDIYYGRNHDPKKISSDLGDKVYITIDLDGLDPSIMPAVGTPEPGGLLWEETLDILRTVCNEKEVVGFDVVELCPIASQVRSDFLASLLTYKTIGYVGRKRGWV